ncbi:hypothetical protein WH06_01940 [Aeromonas salmonicida subsp. salmonicida]|uniref:Phage protein n=2 Tax=Aeromonas salmonicida subsp. salmonicida TaxID=29491 RepID=A0ABN0E5Q7_AERSS|nr:ead/Ea22-like family protein [Aeromonas salmonicida]AIZ49553.1 putative phage protein [Aeromonas salmonicida subsp. salmonicida]AYO63735.1 hypothetical protein C5P03_13650 [Aeromonas salmonicida subsp. salmonicida 01-B526]EHI54303.1 hypothetical protein IYQ_00937 [Aeromonas salmonicida subsp. salmonicida 01-B526]OKA83851.1 hypothetical protein BHR40_03445 [Aeromonas salmonicida subsp. salmonicida]OSM53935.1 hypothetical protein WH06_01940 [Aeromonas salmonicida subsp. salmonicida]
MNIDLEKLLELAGKATPGNWGTDGHTGVHGESGLLADTCFAHDAAFISAANPAVVAELVSMVKGYLSQPANDNASIADHIAKTSADLSWLVRETKGEWFGKCTHIARDGLNDLVWAGPALHGWRRYPDFHWFTKVEYLTRKAELQGKPSWSGAPWWANRLCQTSIGAWVFTEFDVRPNEHGEWSMYVPEGRHFLSGRGEVFGDWHDTLEQRPAGTV